MSLLTGRSPRQGDTSTGPWREVAWPSECRKLPFALLLAHDGLMDDPPKRHDSRHRSAPRDTCGVSPGAPHASPGANGSPPAGQTRKSEFPLRLGLNITTSMAASLERMRRRLRLKEAVIGYQRRLFQYPLLPVGVVPTTSRRIASKNGQKPKPSGWPAYTSSAHRKGETILRGWVVFSAAPAGARGGSGLGWRGTSRRQAVLVMNSFEYNDPPEFERADHLLIRRPNAGKNHAD
jgi:hypothetical protein